MLWSGDHFNVRVGSWYANSSGTYSSPNPLNELINAMVTAIGSRESSQSASQLSSSSGFANQIGNFLSNALYDNTKPKAYLNWILLDEQFNYVASSSGQDQVKTANGASVYYHQFNNLQINKNGYLYVQVSNQTPNQDVFFESHRCCLGPFILRRLLLVGVKDAQNDNGIVLVYHEMNGVWKSIDGFYPHIAVPDRRRGRQATDLSKYASIVFINSNPKP